MRGGSIHQKEPPLSSLRKRTSKSLLAPSASTHKKQKTVDGSVAAPVSLSPAIIPTNHKDNTNLSSDVQPAITLVSSSSVNPFIIEVDLQIIQILILMSKTLFLLHLKKMIQAIWLMSLYLK
ncbi:hypothetical protein CFOL_v3_09977 [Cephalotus follicularis]|uniref:Uncharacterized protein n=1 Tax=Cephalotus follicularis TaxID=3775 RepID=A0A1Q3BEL1_CEPFO|nr:hypothetical protein CFOL_v3_09977 [Cephalotus follicularis]